MFKHEINPFSVTDKITFRNVDKTINLVVRADASILVSGLKRITGRLNEIDEVSDEEKLKVARSFAALFFGDEQSEKLCAFYNDDPLAIISACGMYFQQRLSKIITKAQKKAK